ncbi:MAG: glycosyltransferase family 39 protein, partial [Candidatus Competibacteraceae bacterium]|nr:glycosyltransferase family 39 protein [Candidatus Competibacteraceae bacterium]
MPYPTAPEPLTIRDFIALTLLAVGVVILRVWLGWAAGLELHFDEAQYWEWSQRLDWSYYSKGPWVAWLIALSTGLLGHGEWQVRLPAWLANGIFLILLFAFARDLWGSRRAGWWAAGLGLLTPFYFGLGQVMTSDIWLFTFWTWGLWAAWRAVIR